MTTHDELTVCCAWCAVHLSGPEPDDPAKVSHGCCPNCFALLIAECEEDSPCTA